jgi:hypothetical protein
MAMHGLTLPFSPGNFFTKNSRTVVPHPFFSLIWPLSTFLFPQLKLKMLGSHFDTIAVIEAEYKMVLNAFT